MCYTSLCFHVKTVSYLGNNLVNNQQIKSMWENAPMMSRFTDHCNSDVGCEKQQSLTTVLAEVPSSVPNEHR